MDKTPIHITLTKSMAAYVTSHL